MLAECHHLGLGVLELLAQPGDLVVDVPGKPCLRLSQGRLQPGDLRAQPGIAGNSGGTTGGRPEHERPPGRLRDDQALIAERAQRAPDRLRGAAVLRHHRGQRREPVPWLVAPGLDLPAQVVGDLQVWRPGIGEVRHWHGHKARSGGSARQALVRTPSGGFHAYFAGSEQPSGKIPGRHLDWRAKGGYVVAPPSQVGGRPYEVVHHQPGPAAVDFAAVRQLLDPQPQHPASRGRQSSRDTEATSLDRLVEWTARRQAGDRNFPLFYAAKQAHLAGQLDAEAVERFVDAARRAGLQGGDREARRTIASAQRNADREASARPFGRAPQRQLEAG